MAASYFNYRHAWIFDGPPHKEYRLDKKDWRPLLRKGGLFVRNTYDFDYPEELPFWNLIKDRFGGMEELSGNTKNRVSKALERLEYRLITPDTVKAYGFPILKATFDNYPVSDRPMNSKVFDAYLKHCQDKKCDFWGVFDRENDTFIGFCANYVWEQAAQYDIIGILPEYRHNQTFPYYGLFYSMNRYYLQERGFLYVSDGTRSITEHSNIQPFLEEKFHFRKSYCHLDVHYQWWMKIAVKILYPFRKIITIPQVKAVLNMESMTR